MEEQLGRQQHYYHHHHHPPHCAHQQHGVEARQQPKPVKHEQRHGLPQQETHPKKTEHVEINGTTGERPNPVKILGSDRIASHTASRFTNGSQQATADLNTNSRHIAKTINFNKTSSKTKTFLQKNSMDKKNEKIYESKPKDSTYLDKGEAGLIQNGLLSNNSGFITNGYVSKSGENDGSGSESGYATPKKRKAKCTNAKASESFNLLTGKMSDPDIKLESESFKSSDVFAEQRGGARLDNGKATWKCESGSLGAGRGKSNSAHLQRKNSDAKPVAGKKFDDRPKGKASPVTSSKEDSWTLFKPPPVFPVDNSSAKIVPKISYASKVKENLNKAAQNNSASPSSLPCSSHAVETPASNCVSQVPMSAMKSVSTVNFANGPLLVGGDGVFMAAASTVSHTLPGGAEPLSIESSLASSNPAEQKKSGLFTFPSNMQHALLDVVQAEQSGSANQHSLGEIFQNQWGLSFINEPSAGPDAATDKKETGSVVWEHPTPTDSQGAEIVSSGNERPVFPKAYELEKRTSTQVPDGAMQKAAQGPGVDGTLSLEPQHLGELQKPEAARQGSLVLQSKVYEIEVTLQTSLKNTLQTSAKDKRYHGDLDCKDSWGSFDLRAAIIYHTKEMESILNLQKQDPNRIITYNEAMDHPDH